MKRARYIISLLVIILLFIMFPFSVYAEEIPATTNNETVTTEAKETQPNESLVDADYQTQLEESLALNKELLGVYETWTSIISIILILVTIFGVAVPLYSNFRIDKKINSAKKRLLKEQEKIMEKNLLINNALMLSASKEYWSANEILNDILKRIWIMLICIYSSAEIISCNTKLKIDRRSSMMKICKTLRMQSITICLLLSILKQRISTMN